jgi:asparagine synthase (glutamine-hydrolysing)
MAHSLETRVPFLDNDLVDFAMTVPISLKLMNLKEVARINENEPGKVIKYYNKNRDGKIILRNVMKKYIPDIIVEGVKKGFSAPDASWFKGDSIEYVKQIIFDPKARIYDYISPKVTQKLVSEHLEGKSNRRLLIWSIINFEWWLNRYLP